MKKLIILQVLVIHDKMQVIKTCVEICTQITLKKSFCLEVFLKLIGTFLTCGAPGMAGPGVIG